MNATCPCNFDPSFWTDPGWLGHGAPGYQASCSSNWSTGNKFIDIETRGDFCPPEAPNCDLPEGTLSMPSTVTGFHCEGGTSNGEWCAHEDDTRCSAYQGHCRPRTSVDLPEIPLDFEKHMGLYSDGGGWKCRAQIIVTGWDWGGTPDMYFHLIPYSAGWISAGSSPSGLPGSAISLTEEQHQACDFDIHQLAEALGLGYCAGTSP